MSKRLTPYGSTDHSNLVAKVGKSKTPMSLASRMPSPELAAKVGGSTSAMFSSPAEPFAKPGARQVVRRSALA